MEWTNIARRCVISAPLAVALGGIAGGPALAQQAAPADKNPPATDTTQVQARNLLMRMARYLGDAKSFSVSLSSNYETVQASGQKIDFGERRKVVLSRPNRLRMEAEHSDGSQVAAVFTSKEIVLIDTTNKVFAKAPQPASLDETIVYFVSDLGMRFPLAVLLMSRAPAELEKRVRSIDYVEKTNLLGTPSHHLAARTDMVDFQIWIADGAQPVPLRVIISYRNQPGQPEFRAEFADWNFAPALTDTTFAPDIPAGSRQIAFATQLAAAVPTANKATSKGGK